MRSAAATVAERGADLIDLNMGCPVPKVCKTGAGAALIKDPDTAVAVARAAREGSGLPVTVKLRSGQRPGETDGYDARAPPRRTRPASARSASTRAAPPSTTRARPTTTSPRGSSQTPRRARDPHRRPARPRRGAATPTSAPAPPRSCSPAARSATRGCSASVLGDARRASPRRDEVLGELDWVMDRAVEHLGPERAARYLRKFYPWYLDRIGRREGAAAGPPADGRRWTRRGPFSRASGTCRAAA